MENFRQIAEEMLAKGAAFEVADAEELVKAVSRLLGDEALRGQVAAAADAIARQRAEVLDTVISQLEPVMAGVAARAPETVGSPTVGGSADARP